MLFNASALHCLFTFAIAILAGAVNSVAGGGTLLTFPVMLACGMDKVAANCTNTVGLLPAAFMGARGFSGGMRAQARAMLPFYIVSLLGGVAGSVLLIITPTKVFDAVLPWLILMSALIFLLHDTISRHLLKNAPASPASSEAPQQSRSQEHAPPRKWALVFQFFVAVYGGYFGAGIGIMMLAALSLMKAGDIYRMNFLKNLAAFVINGVSAILFAAGRLVNWPIALSMAVGAVIGGWSGAGIAKKVGPRWTRRMVSIVGLSMAAYMIYRQSRGS